MRVRYAVTFEKPETQPPLTVRGMVEAGRPPAAVRRAMEAAIAQAPGKQWDSILVLIERVEHEDAVAKPKRSPSAAEVSDEVEEPDT